MRSSGTFTCKTTLPNDHWIILWQCLSTEVMCHEEESFFLKNTIFFISRVVSVIHFPVRQGPVWNKGQWLTRHQFFFVACYLFWTNAFSRLCHSFPQWKYSSIKLYLKTSSLNIAWQLGDHCEHVQTSTVELIQTLTWSFFASKHAVPQQLLWECCGPRGIENMQN